MSKRPRAVFFAPDFGWRNLAYNISLLLTGQAFLFGGNISSLIPVLVTGIQPTRVCVAKESIQSKNLGWRDSCDEHRNGGT